MRRTFRIDQKSSSEKTLNPTTSHEADMIKHEGELLAQEEPLHRHRRDRADAVRSR